MLKEFLKTAALTFFSSAVLAAAAEAAAAAATAVDVCWWLAAACFARFTVLLSNFRSLKLWLSPKNNNKKV